MTTLTLLETAMMLHMHTATLARKARTGEIPAAKPGKCWVFIEIDVLEYLRSQYTGRCDLQSERKESICHSTSARIQTCSGSASPTTDAAYSNLLGLPTPSRRRSTTTVSKLPCGSKRLGVKPSHSWKEAVVRWLQETSDKATHKEDIVKLKWFDPHLGPLNLDQITVDVINQVKLEKLKAASKSTVNRYLALIRSILLRARDEWEWVDKVPKVKLYKEAVGRVRYINQEQVTTLLKELPAHQRDLVLFALHTGLRQSNVLNLEWSRINLELKHAWVEAEQSKNRHPIAVPLNDEAMAILHRQLGKHPVRVFTYAGKPLGNANTRAWRNALKRAGIADFRWHDLRHTWATWHRQAGTPTHELQRLGGWKTSAMVERYAHLAPEHLAGAAARLNLVGSCYDSATDS